MWISILTMIIMPILLFVATYVHDMAVYRAKTEKQILKSSFWYSITIICFVVTTINVFIFTN